MPARRAKARPRSRKPAARVDYKALFEAQMRAEGVPEPVREFPFEPDRGAAGYRWDWAWPASIKIAVEFDGGIYAGRASHSSIAKMQRDRDKSNLSVCLGWRALRITHKNVESGLAIKQLVSLLATVPATDLRLYREAWLPIYRNSSTTLRPARGKAPSPNGLVGRLCTVADKTRTNVL